MVNGKRPRQIVPANLPISRSASAVKNKTLVTEAASHGNSGPACRGPFAENRHKRIRVAPSTARIGLDSFGTPLSVNQLVCDGGSAKSQVQQLSAPSCSHSQSENLVNHTNPENLVPRTANLRTWSPSKREQQHTDCMSRYGGNDRGSNMASSSEQCELKRSTADIPRSNSSNASWRSGKPGKCAHTSRRPASGLLDNPLAASRECAPHTAEGNTTRPPDIGCNDASREVVRDNCAKSNSE